jgi:hypothetical protein
MTGYRLPGLSVRAATHVVELAEDYFPDWDKPAGRPRKLALMGALRLCLCRLRRNATYNDLSEDFGLADSTAWDYHQLLVAFLADVLGCPDEDLPELVKGKVCLIDGSLIPTFDWRHAKQLFSGKHRRAGMNVLFLVDLHGRLVAASRAFPGAWHDTHCLAESEWERTLGFEPGWLGDAGFAGTTGTVPSKKPAGRDLTADEKAFNKRVRKMRTANEWGIGHAKNWRILTTRYRSDLTRIDTDIQATIGLQKLNEQFSGIKLSWDRVKNAISE